MENELDPEIIKLLDEKISPYLERIKKLEDKQLEKEKEIVILKHAVNDILLKIDENKKLLKKLPKNKFIKVIHLINEWEKASREDNRKRRTSKKK